MKIAHSNRNPMSPIEESKPAMCLSPQEKLKSVTNQRSSKRSRSGSLAAASDAKKARLDDVFKTELEIDMDGWISDDYLRTMDLDDCLNQDIDWVAHDEVDLALSMDGDDVNDLASFMSPLRGGLAFEDSAEMASTFVDPAYIRLESTSKDAEKLLMSFDTMNFKIPSPTSAASKQRDSVFSDKDKKTDAKSATNASALKVQVTAAEKQVVRSSSNSSLSVSATSDPLSVLNTGVTTPKASNSSEKKIGSYTPEARKLRLQKFHEKRKNRTWKKSIKYDCRKKLADDRPRIKGRFVRVLENAGDAKAGAASCPAKTSPTTAGYASPTSPSGAVAPSMTLPSSKATPMAPQNNTAATAPRVVPSCASAKQPAASSVVSTSVARSSAALPFARMIASV